MIGLKTPVEPYLIRRFVFSLLFAALFLFPTEALANAEFAAQTGEDCKACHQSPQGVADLTPYGEAFRRGGYQYPIPDDAFRAVPLYKKIVRLVIGYFHLMAGVVWFGTIFYAHIIIKPQALTQGLPRSELILGWVCIIIIGLTGTLLSVARINSFSQLYTTRFGAILLVKTILFLMMVGIAMTTTFVIQKGLKQRTQRQEKDGGHPKEFFTHTELLAFDGTGSQPTYVAVDEEVFDVSESPAWKDGRHMAQHFAGRDLSDALLGAPHGKEVLSHFKKAGRLWQGKIEVQLQIGSIRKAFFFLAKSALVISFLILLCVALWRWG